MLSLHRLASRIITHLPCAALDWRCQRSASAVLMSAAARQLRSHCPDGGIKENISCFFYQDVDFVEQQGLRAVNFTTASLQSIASKAHQVDWPWWMAAACACILLPGLLYWLCKTPKHNDLAYEELQQEEDSCFAGVEGSCCACESDCGVSADTKTRVRVFLEAIMLAVDVALDIKVGVYYCSQGLWLFGPMALSIPALAGLACFGYKRWIWQKGLEDDRCYWKNLDEKGRPKPGLLALLRQVFQVEFLTTAYETYQDPERYQRDWLIEQTFNGVLEGFPQCLLQTYTLLCLEQEALQTDPMDTAIQVFSIAFSCYSIAKALGHICFTLVPLEPVSLVPSGLSGWQLLLLQFADVASRLLCWCTLGAALRNPSADIDENGQFVLPVLMIAEFLAVALLLRSFLEWDWDPYTSMPAAKAILSMVVAYLSTPMLIFASGSLADNHRVQTVLCCWRGFEVLVCLCIVWYRTHAVSEPHTLLLAFMICNAGACIAVLATVVFDRFMRLQRGRPILPAALAQGFNEAHWACVFNNLELLKSCGSDSLSAKVYRGWIPAHLAAENDREAVLKLLYERAPETLSAQDDDGQVPAHFAAGVGQTAALSILHDLVPETLGSKENIGCVPAHLAALSGQEDVLKLLYELVPETLSAQDIDGRVPAHYAAESGREAVLKLLYELVPETLSAKDNSGRAPAHRTAECGRENVLKLLSKLAPETLSAQDVHDQVPAHWAARTGQEAVLKLLYELVPDTVSARDADGSMPAHRAAEHGQEDVLKLLSKLAPETLFARDNSGKVPAHWAARTGQEAVLKLLYKLVPETLSARDVHDQVPAHWAARTGQEAVLKLLYELVPETLSARDVHDQVPAHWAARTGQEAVLKLLYELVPETLSARDNGGRFCRVPAQRAGGCLPVLLSKLAPETLSAKDHHGKAPEAAGIRSPV